MIQQTMRVLHCGEPETITKKDGTKSLKRQIRLQELGGYSRNDDLAQQVGNAIVATMLGNLAQCQLYLNDVVQVSLRCSIRCYQDQWYQDIMVVDIVKVG